ncbi:MAG: pyruvate synthase subunit beta [Candidatus Aminicenantes bacterium]|nr:MAG: pyruvate synthase subunit beta [Candidatus Aminicenantes bacterium]
MYKYDTTSRGLVAHGVSTCAGCGLEVVIRKILEVLGKNTVIVIPPGCAALFSGYGRETTLKIPGLQGNLENTAAYAAGIRAGFEMQGRDDITVLGLAGDGATVDIGIQALSGVFERGDKILYVCYDNEAYMNTGIQGSGSTPLMASTTTTPAGKPAPRKNMLEIAAAHGIPYAASASVGYIEDLKKKVEKARQADGPAYLHIHTPCPTGWAFDPSLTIEMAKSAVQTGAWILMEMEKGKLKLNRKLEKLKPVEEYLKPQGRFKHITETDIKNIQEDINNNIIRLKQKINR